MPVDRECKHWLDEENAQTYIGLYPEPLDYVLEGPSIPLQPFKSLQNSLQSMSNTHTIRQILPI